MKKICNQTLVFCPGMEKLLWKSLATIKYLVTNILKNIFFCVEQRKETHTDLEQLGGEPILTELSFWGELLLYCSIFSYQKPFWLYITPE